MESVQPEANCGFEEVILPLIAPYISGTKLALVAGVCKRAAYDRDISPYEGYFETKLPEEKRRDARQKYLWCLRRNLLIEPAWKKVTEIGGEEVLGRFLPLTLRLRSCSSASRFGASSASFIYQGKSAALLYRFRPKPGRGEILSFQQWMDN
eukprot:365796-Hanusia_phi.AAC.3